MDESGKEMGSYGGCNRIKSTQKYNSKIQEIKKKILKNKTRNIHMASIHDTAVMKHWNNNLNGSGAETNKTLLVFAKQSLRQRNKNVGMCLFYLEKILIPFQLIINPVCTANMYEEYI